MKILLTNDDGINAPGIEVLYRALKKAQVGEIYVIAPATEKSGTGVSITWDRPMHIQKVPWADGTSAWSVDGTPADCVKIGSRVILKEKPDLIFSGINAGSNAGRNVLHSGTIGAVVEGVLRGIPGVAVSCEDGKNPNYHVAEKYIEQIFHYVQEHPMPVGSFLNVNFPHAAQDEVRGFKLTRQGQGRWVENPYLHMETESGPSYWLGGKPEESTESYDCDIALLREGYMTAVPIHVHELTDKQVLEEKEKTFEDFFSCPKSV